MEKLVRELEIEDNVIFTGKVDHSEIQDYYRLIDLFIVPRRRDYASDLAFYQQAKAINIESPTLQKEIDKLFIDSRATYMCKKCQK